MGNLTHTVSGWVASFRSAARVPIESLKCYFEPIQEGTGDPSPNNIRPIRGWNDINYYIKENNLFEDVTTISGYKNDNGVLTASQNSYHTSNMFDIDINDLNAYRLVYENTGNFVFRIYFFDNEGKWISRSSQMTYTFSRAPYFIIINNIVQFPQNCAKIQFQFNVVVNFNKVKFLKGKITHITFPGIGKNLLDPSQAIAETGMNGILFGREPSNSQGTMFLPAGTYTFSSNVQADVISITNSKKINTNGIQQNTNTYTFTLNTDDYIGIMFYKNNVQPEEFLSYQYQLEAGDTATAYEPFDNTIYGGYIDIVKGEIIQEWRKISTNTINYIFTAEGKYGAGFGVGAGINYSPDSISLLVCNNLKCYTTHEHEPPYIYLRPNGDNEHYYLYFTLGKLTDEDYIANGDRDWIINKVKTWITENNCILYRKAPPITHKLSSIQLKTILDQNYIWSNTYNNTEVSYAVHDSAMIRSSKKQIIGNEPHIISINNSFSHFKTDINAPIKSAKFNFLPKQSGTGNPSPSNIRPITGWSSIQIKTLNNYIPVLPLNEQEYFYDDTNTYRLQYLGNGKFKAIDDFPISSAPIFNFDTIPITWSSNINMCIAISDVKDTIGQWNFIFSFRTPDNNNLLSGYLDYGQGSQALLVQLNNISVIYDQTTTKMRLMISKEGMPQGSEFVLALIDKTNIISYTSDFSTSNATLPIYGGYVDLITGELVQTYQKVTATGASSENWTFMQTTGDNPNRVYTSITNLNGNVPQFNSLDYVDNFYCNYIYKERVSNLEWSGYISNYNNNLLIGVPKSTITSLADWTNYLSENPLEIVYELATPIHYQLTPTQLKSLIGTNNIWSNANGNIEIQYWKH